ncbi:MAG TPA: OmpA family protein [Kofleriaceae bacterium]|nr:OmpA family protein [Kofleriaceae bacterium]
MGWILSGALLGACGASLPSPQLVDARHAYQVASSGNAAQYAPANVIEARRALDAAEIAYRDGNDPDYQRYTAHLALRSAQIATERGDAIAARAAYDQRQAARNAALERQAARSAALERQADAARAEKARAEQELAQRDAELAQRDAQDAELAARAEQAERERNDALASLRQLAAIQETERGLVITLAGSLLFRTGESTLLPVAQQRLDQVAAALQTLAGGQTFVIEGHTDSVGTSDANIRLSGARADAVRAYLVSRGVPPEQIVAVAKGEGEPVAPNNTAEGRANNRRVEIVLSRPSVPTAAQR